MIYKTPKKVNAETYQQIESDMKKILETGEDIYLDFSETEYISSFGIRVLLMGMKTFRNKNFDFAVINPNPLVKEILEKTGLESILIHNDIEKYKQRGK